MAERKSRKRTVAKTTAGAGVEKTKKRAPRVKKQAAEQKVSRLQEVAKRLTKKAAAGSRRVQKAIPVLDIREEGQKIEEAKFISPPHVEQKWAGQEQYQLPGGYGETKIVLMVRDPYWLYAYWEITASEAERIKAEVGEDIFSSAKLVLRVYDITGVEFTGFNANGYFDIEISSYLGNWYIQVGRPNCAYIVDVGYRTPDGRFLLLARSNAVLTPRDAYSEIIDEEWMIPDWEKLYALSGGFGIGRSSEEIRKMMKMRLEERMGSGWVSSISSPGRPQPQRPFWLAADAELIVYGATEPTAKLTVAGKPVRLRKDGTFSLRFALPDGVQEIPIEATRDDGKEKRRITPVIKRKTR